MYNDYFESPLGLIEFKATDKGIRQLIFCGDQRAPIKTNALTQRCQEQLAAYFAGELSQFDLSLDWQGTAFQQQVWQVLMAIPFGHTLSYKDIAEQLNNPNSVRAVGGANGRNPISIIVPCHRVIGANGKLTGYAGGTARKAWLLEHEGIEVNAGSEQLPLPDIVGQRQAKTEFLQ